MFQPKFRAVIAVAGLPSDAPFEFRGWSLPAAKIASLAALCDGWVKRGTGFQFTVNIPDCPWAMVARFWHVGQTAACCVLSRDERGDPRRVHSVTALLSNIDPAEDRRAIASVRDFASLRGIEPRSFDDPLRAGEPRMASFFPDEDSARQPAIHAVNKLLAGVFFGQFGCAEE